MESLQEIQRWLSGCEYVSDHRLFQERDFWQHPRTFEQIRRGDCEDFALWAWRKLIELRYDADFVVGRCGVDPVTGLARARFEGNAWVMFRRDGCTYLYEPTLRDETLAVQVVETVRHRYVPEFGVGPTRRPFGFAGYLLSMREQHLPREERPVGGDGHAT